MHSANTDLRTSHPSASGTVLSEIEPRPHLVPGAVVSEFSTFRVDRIPNLLAECYALRYQVYCVERHFLPASKYRDGREIDEFDRYAWHFATVDSAGEVVATARLVLPSLLGLPLFRHCTIFAEEYELHEPGQAVVEVSRLAMSRRVSRAELPLAGRPMKTTAALRESVAFSLYRGLYQESKRAGFSHWLVATEASLQLAVRHYGFPFRPIGPEIDYFGPVTPYLMNLATFDAIVLGGMRPRLNGFLDGLEHRYLPESIPASVPSRL